MLICENIDNWVKFKNVNWIGSKMLTSTFDSNVQFNILTNKRTSVISEVCEIF